MRERQLRRRCRSLLRELDIRPPLDVAALCASLAEAVWRGLRRTSYDTEQEHAAETAATLILQWASVLDAVVPRLSAGTAERRMHGALGDRMGWL